MRCALSLCTESSEFVMQPVSFTLTQSEPLFQPRPCKIPGTVMVVCTAEVLSHLGALSGMACYLGKGTGFSSRVVLGPIQTLGLLRWFELIIPLPVLFCTSIFAAGTLAITAVPFYGSYLESYKVIPERNY